MQSEPCFSFIIVLLNNVSESLRANIFPSNFFSLAIGQLIKATDKEKYTVPGSHDSYSHAPVLFFNAFIHLSFERKNFIRSSSFLITGLGKNSIRLCLKPY